MTPRERIKHEFFLLQGKLGEDAQFFHFDLCPDPMPEEFQLTFDSVYWTGVTPEEVIHNCSDDTLREFVRHRMLNLCIDTKLKIDEIIEILEKEKPDA